MRTQSRVVKPILAPDGQCRGSSGANRLGNLKFAHYGAVSYMKELAPKSRLKIEERVFTKGLDINPAIVAGEIDASAAAPDAAIARVLAIDSPILLMEELDRHQEDEFRGAAVD